MSVTDNTVKPLEGVGECRLDMLKMTATMHALRFHEHGPWGTVLRLEEASVPQPKEGQIRIKVLACALNPMDVVLCLGFMPGPKPGGVGLDVSGVVDALGPGVSGVRVGDLIFGRADFMGHESAGAAEYAILAVWQLVPAKLDLCTAAALPMVVETAVRAIDLLGVTAGSTLVVNGGGTMTGFAAVQVALLRGSRVVAIAGSTFAGQLNAMGAHVTSYGEGVVERVREILGGAPDLVLHTAQVRGALPELVRMVNGEAKRVMSISDFDEDGLGVRTTGREAGMVSRYDAFAEYARLAAEGRFVVPIARTFGLKDWGEAFELLASGKAHGKLLILPDRS